MRTTILPMYLWGAGLAAVILFVLSLGGCATTKDAEVCFVKPLGNTEEGLIVVLQHCMTPEAFAETQR